MNDQQNRAETAEQTGETDAIQFRDFCLSYPGPKGKPPLQVLRDVTLSVRPGELITIVGPSGCGKTTLLRAVAGLLVQEEDDVAITGSLRVFGMSPLEAKRQRTFAFTFQNPVLLPWRTVRQNVALPLEIAHDTETPDVSQVDEMLSMVGIGEFSCSMSAQLSGGMQQRVNLARALVQEPRILLMDEPFGSLDEVTRERLNFELLRIHRLKKQTILFVTHNLTEAALLADRVLVLTKRPSTIREVIPIGLPQDRTDDTLLSPAFLAHVRKVRDVFTREEAAT
jgi:NitT/TauT family transport system ATP-binding protein